MPLFNIKRYDADSDSTGQVSKATYLSRLKHLLQDANKRKEALASLSAQKTSEEPEQSDEVVVLETAEDDGGVTVKEIKEIKEQEVHRKKKKKRKDKNKIASPQVNETEVALTEKTESNQVSTKHKKRKRKASVDNNNNNDDEEEAISSRTLAKKLKFDSESVGKYEDKVKVDTEADVDANCVNEDQHLEVPLEKQNGDVNESFIQEGPHEFGEFTVLGEYKRQEVQKVSRKLPDWLVKPNLIKTDLSEEKTHVSEFEGLDAKLKKKLQENGINYFFPVQCQLLPVLLKDVRFGVNVGCAGYHPRDICCSSPTGSGKTFAFVLPILQSLKGRVVCRVRALVVLPARSLAQQVFNVFRTYAADLHLKVILIMGEKVFQKEQESLVERRSYGYESLADIVVATPGKLVDHINQTEGFDLTHLRFLVIDEADRVFDIMKYDWLTNLEKAVYKMPMSDSGTSCRPKPGPITINQVSKISTPFQKLLFSATLTDDSEKLQKVNLFQPRLFLASQNILKSSNKSGSESALPNTEEPGNDIKKQKNNVNGEQNIRFIIPESLKEEYLICNPSEKVIALLHLVLDRGFHSVVCFTNSVESTHRLCLLLKHIDKFPVAEFSSRIKVNQKENILAAFSKGSIRLLVCTDTMARGMDLLNIDLVVSYEYPKFVETYIHRVGRTARAGQQGTSVSLLEFQQVVHLKTMRKQCQSKSSLSQIKLTNQVRKKYVPLLRSAVEALPISLKAENKKNQPNKKTLQSSKA
ncbi:ATP-dependent RNA helicase DDX51 [Octopus bimaculoides]|uniref:ATP-dependent RNA helicase n=1 Tax=Octopus bimaculoides TaxID=37653 RepID=A0A0L8G0Z2_OCTBM|nr:ATP-dependent RNA helicase DDX51 [Octopus bimaculoides]|eukprot:XP_014785200.1 PREDICTED: ATP-dependent RNA helicase DDX51-like [Octopus bimaculoides]